MTPEWAVALVDLPAAWYDPQMARTYTGVRGLKPTMDMSCETIYIYGGVQAKMTHMAYFNILKK